VYVFAYFKQTDRRSKMYAICRETQRMPNDNLAKIRKLIRQDHQKEQSLKLLQHYCHCDLRRYNFTNRNVSVWNSLPNNVVTANTTNTFKNRLDKFWEHQDVLYNYRANITGIGNHSIAVD